MDKSLWLTFWGHPLQCSQVPSPHGGYVGETCHLFYHQCIYSTTEQYKYSDNVDTNEVETGMTRLIALTVTPVY